MRILKVKWKDKELTAKYALPNKASGYDEYEVKYEEEPVDEFLIALAKLAPDALELCELKEEWLMNTTVTGVSFAYSGEKEVMGATITFQVKIQTANTPLCMNTPFKPSDSYNDNEPLPNQCLNFSTIRKLNEVIVQTRAYIMGTRKQQEMNLPEKENKETPQKKKREGKIITIDIVPDLEKV